MRSKKASGGKKMGQVMSATIIVKLTTKPILAPTAEP